MQTVASENQIDTKISKTLNFELCNFELCTLNYNHLNKQTTFAPGPSQIYFTVEDHIRQAFREGVPSISHRSKMFESIFGGAVDGLRTLLNVPKDFYIVFTSSATEVWDRSIQNLVDRKSLHYVNGSFSKRYYEIALQLGKNAIKIESPLGFAFDVPAHLEPEVELVGLTHNETSTGVSLPLSFIDSIRERYPNALIVVDAVSSLPYPQFDFSKIDSLFFSVQKGFGLPAGLGVWMINPKCIEKAEQLQKKGSIGSYHTIPTLVSNAKKNQTPETPNVLGIYLLNKVVEDFNRRGIQTIRKETEYKAAILYQLLSKHALLSPFVIDRSIQSQTVIVANSGEHTKKVNDYLASHGLLAGDGYGELKSSQLRFANFPAHSREQYELLVDLLEKYS